MLGVVALGVWWTMQLWHMPWNPPYPREAPVPFRRLPQHRWPGVGVRSPPPRRTAPFLHIGGACIQANAPRALGVGRWGYGLLRPLVQASRSRGLLRPPCLWGGHS